MIRAFLLALFLLVSAPIGAQAQQSDLQSILQDYQEIVASPSRRTVGPMLEALAASGLPGTLGFLEAFQNRDVWVRGADGLFFYVIERDDDQFTLLDIATGEEVGTADKSEIEQIRPNGGVRREIGSALVQFQLSDPDIERRQAAVDAIARDLSADQIGPLSGAIDNEADPDLKARKEMLLGMLIAGFGDVPEERITAIETLADRSSVEARAVLNQILRSSSEVAADLPEGENIAGERIVGVDLSREEAYLELVDAGLAPQRISADALRAALVENLADGAVGGVPVDELGDPARRVDAYQALAEAGQVAPFVTEDEITAALAAHTFYDVYAEADASVTRAAEEALAAIETRVAMGQAVDLGLDALSLASIYFLAAIGLAVTFGVMGVINMAHGEFIMMGAYTGYVVQLVIPDYTLSLVVALPLAFAVTFAAGVAMERLVIRWLYHRPLETLLATFGISIALQQLAKNIFGTQARPLTSPGWLDGARVVNDVVQISYIRIAIFVLALMFLVLILFILNRTRLGLEVRAVTQNPGMAASMGINPDRINMLTFGLGSGVAGIAGVAIGLYAKVTSEMGSDYIVQSFMTVVVGGVGNVWGTLAGAALIGSFQKGIEWLNPSNTLAAQTYMIIIIIIFIQFRPRGIIALKGRAAGG
ncbi:urea ABC transporter permease subunit UrtB [Ponticoccus sp. SC2-23]|uniref:urea ABC transporter permease subunit UrtB n=1 Tax=Alexandriicola marinus TaxID=2081710 RepID=UPI000FDC9077|nr:urea ABC transporter permease subunit UrtB [Alexandriicola marinus]MBM1221476.1 urea ABC transporter permease subunit UrtB [Ponticoccus sp. SC6-9]MBM1226517.1 urea ABC transporter permease subunit UrtB [Ponticoccus sp. SC6-15]MBM1230468.1 urea ABC transporter permease subunit UrtB [Ponticoccus sp. SC6-38]MBM1234991.1 urea ABC transporter permease subunit UrtB [Ponticoccus sp. SC6-45]MBM1239489.1 urea ABC transporter permease subunit UrtB [Ponticoccus sp. SC6-49]MBM1243271.1 urea ABC transp